MASLSTDSSEITCSIHTETSSMCIAHNNNDRELQQKYANLTPNVAAEMEKWYAMTDRYGFIEEPITEPTESQKEKEVKRSLKWATMTKDILVEGSHDFEFNQKLIQRVYKGIPDCWRRDAWYYLCTNRLRNIEQDGDLKMTYERLLNKTTANERQIDLDIPRTMHGHIMFRQRYGAGQRSLFNVLRAFAGYDEQVGYCQGMANIVATILMYLEDEKAFLMLVHMFLRDNLHDLYIPGFPALMESFYIQEKLLMRLAPKLANHLAHIGLSTDMFATRWYITLFTGGVVRYQTLLRIWDVYFLEGFNIFYCVSVALLLIHKDKLVSFDLEETLAFVGGTLGVPDDNQFIKLVRKLYEKTKHRHYIESFREQYQRQSTS